MNKIVNKRTDVEVDKTISLNTNDIGYEQFIIKLPIIIKIINCKKNKKNFIICFYKKNLNYH